MFDKLFSPLTINGVSARNRITYPALGLLYSTDGTLNDRYYDYFAERARGGAGIVTVGPVGIDIDDAIPSFAKLAALIKKEGALSWIQLFHTGAESAIQHFHMPPQ